MASVLLLGMGNVLRGDDGLGVYALRRLAEEGLEGADTLELGTSLADCFSVLEGYAHIVALDAVVAGGAPGSLYWLPREAFEQALSGRLTLHGGDLLEALDIAALRGRHPVLHVAGMEPARWRDWSMDLSSPVRSAFPVYLDMVREKVLELTKVS